MDGARNPIYANSRLSELSTDIQINVMQLINRIAGASCISHGEVTRILAEANLRVAQMDRLAMYEALIDSVNPWESRAMPNMNE